MRKIKCRETLSSHKRYLYLAGFTKSGPVLGITIICILLPAMFYGCNKPITVQDNGTALTRLHVQAHDSDINHTLDVLVFNNDRLESLNTYQRFDSWDSGTLEASSSGGDMTFTILANAQREKYDWAQIRSRSNLSEITLNLENERRNYPAMIGETRSFAGDDISIGLKSISSEILIKRLTCDFSSGTYSGCLIENPRIYLINVNAVSSADGNQERIEKRFINTGRADAGDIGNFKEPDLIYQELDNPIGPKGLEREISLLCYANQVSEESPGSPFTRLVIEGTVKGTTYYWAFNISNDSGNPEVLPDCRYTYDIHITRPGTTDPDIPIETTEGEIFLEIERWKEKDEYGVRF